VKNIGPVSRRWLAEVGVESLADLEALGPITTYRLIRSMRGGKVSLNLLWALVGALEGLDSRQLSQARKDEYLKLLHSASGQRGE